MSVRGTSVLVAEIAVLIVLFGVRGVLQARRTGDAGFRLSARSRSARLGGALFGCGLLAGVVGAAVAAFGAWEPSRPFASFAAAAVGWVLFAAGTFVAVAGQSGMGSSWRVGVDPSERTELVRSGLFGRVRNPIFSGMILMAVGLATVVPSWWTLAAVVLLVAGVEVQVRWVEEPYLRSTHLPWADYARVVGRFVPVFVRHHDQQDRSSSSDPRSD
jgi:protein-S-isoprenylcysteine O-methyltransferase Ste14